MKTWRLTGFWCFISPLDLHFYFLRLLHSIGFTIWLFILMLDSMRPGPHCSHWKIQCQRGNKIKWHLGFFFLLLQELQLGSQTLQKMKERKSLFLCLIFLACFNNFSLYLKLPKCNRNSSVLPSFDPTPRKCCPSLGHGVKSLKTSQHWNPLQLVGKTEAQVHTHHFTSKCLSDLGACEWVAVHVDAKHQWSGTHILHSSVYCPSPTEYEIRH